MRSHCSGPFQMTEMIMFNQIRSLYIPPLAVPDSSVLLLSNKYARTSVQIFITFIDSLLVQDVHS